MYFSILSEGASFFEVSLGDLLVHSHSLIAHFAHDFPGFLVLEVVELVPFCLLPAPGLFLPLFFLLHDDLVPNHFFEDDVVQNVSQEFVLHRYNICLN